jgi:hypothetical protein
MLFGKKKSSPSGPNEWADTENYVELPKVSAFPVASEGEGQIARPFLEVRIGFLTGALPLQSDVIRIGRSDAEQNYRPDVDMGSDDAVSRRHAEVRRRSGQFVVVDLGSTNGTQLNGEMMVPHVEMPLADGSEIRLGAMSLIKVHL